MPLQHCVRGWRFVRGRHVDERGDQAKDAQKRGTGHNIAQGHYPGQDSTKFVSFVFLRVRTSGGWLPASREVFPLLQPLLGATPQSKRRDHNDTRDPNT